MPSSPESGRAQKGAANVAEDRIGGLQKLNGLNGSPRVGRPQMPW